MTKLIVKRNWEYDYDFGGKSADGWIIVEHKNDDAYYAKVYDRKLAEIVRRALERAL